jgi:hypothetical protein
MNLIKDKAGTIQRCPKSFGINETIDELMTLESYRLYHRLCSNLEPLKQQYRNTTLSHAKTGMKSFITEQHLEVDDNFGYSETTRYEQGAGFLRQAKIM